MHKSAVITRSLLGWGIVAGPFYLTLGVTQALLREGFDFSRHALSHLANGSWGWVQTLNFLLCGAMVIAAAIGIARVLGPTARSMCWFLGAYGVGMLLAAFFPADPVDGLPPGTPLGMPTSISTTGIIHFVAAGLGLVSLVVGCFVATFSFRRRGDQILSRSSLAAGVIILVGFFAGPALGKAGILGIWIAVIAAWAWLAIVSWQMYRISPDPNC